MKEITYFEATDIKAKCPYCGEWLNGWLGDPRGKETQCDFCGKNIKVSFDIDIDICY